MAEFSKGDSARVIAETGNPDYPIGTTVVVVKDEGPGFGGHHPVHVYREGKGNIVETALPAHVLEKIGR